MLNDILKWYITVKNLIITVKMELYNYICLFIISSIIFSRQFFFHYLLRTCALLCYLWERKTLAYQVKLFIFMHYMCFCIIIIIVEIKNNRLRIAVKWYVLWSFLRQSLPLQSIFFRNMHANIIAKITFIA